VVSVPVEPEGKVFVVRVRIAGGPEARFVVDTGAGTSAISAVCARRLSLPYGAGLRVRTATGLASVGTLNVPGLCVGELEANDLRLAVVPLRNDRVDGLLGLDFFHAVGAASVALVLDPRAPRLEVTLHR
jgi:predicted aspartyl protease